MSLYISRLALSITAVRRKILAVEEVTYILTQDNRALQVEQDNRLLAAEQYIPNPAPEF